MNIPAEEINERKRIYENLREHILKSQLSNSENFDKAILSLASAFLVASLSFTNNIVPLEKALHSWQLYLSWLLFISAIISTIMSYQVSQKGFKILLDNLKSIILNSKKNIRTQIKISGLNGMTI